MLSRQLKCHQYWKFRLEEALYTSRFVVIHVHTNQSHSFVLFLVSLEVLNDNSWIWIGMVWILKEGVANRVHQNKRKWLVSFSTVLQVIKQLCHSLVEFAITIDEWIVFTKMIRNFFE